MKRLISFSLALLITFCVLVGTDRRAWGYVDPGSGLIALQTFASIMAAGAYFVRRRIRDFFRKKEEPVVVVLPVANKAGDTREVA